MKWLIGIIIIGLIAGCSFAPKYHRPVRCVPCCYKEMGMWLLANPNAAILDRGPWWQMYNDPTLDNLEEQLPCANQNLKAALARYEEARANVAVARSQLFPSVNGLANADRERTSRTVGNPLPFTPVNDVIFGAVVSYELDLWGRIRNTVAAAKSLACASKADLAAVELSLRAELAEDYFSLRGADKTQQVLDTTVAMYERSLKIVRHRYQEGTDSEADLDLAQNQLDAAKAAADNNRLIRQQFEHAIAILIGVPPALFTLCEIKSWQYCMVRAVPEIPSTLLERRPDIVEAEENVKAANANIGVARAAFFPQINLAGAIGFESKAFGQLLRLSSLIWSLGPLSALRLNNALTAKPLITQILYDGGLNVALTEEAIAKYCETVADYRQSVLNAFREVEDGLVAIRQLDCANHSQTLATIEAQRAFNQALYRYRGGIITYLDVVVIQNIFLQAQLTEINIRTQRQVSSVQLIKALGGGWDACMQ